MKEFSVIFLKNPDAGVSHYSLSSKLLYSVMGLCCCGVMALGYLYYFQHQTIVQQRRIIAAQEQTKAEFQQEIDAFAEKKERIVFLENYIEELKQSAYSSETSLKKHLALFKTSTEKLAEVNHYICKTLDVVCLENSLDPQNPHQAVSWMENVYQNFQQFNHSLKTYSSRKTTFEEQSTMIKLLQSKIAQTERDMAEHLQFVQSKGETVDQLSQKIQQVTGVTFRPREELKRKKSTGRGGPSLSDLEALGSENIGVRSRYLRQYLNETSDYYNEVVNDFEQLSLSIEQNRVLWRNTPTILPTESQLISDDYGMRFDPFTNRPAFHGGTDFVARMGTEITAPADGVIRLARRQSGYGLLVEIQHGRGFHPVSHNLVRYRTRFGHLSRLMVEKGQAVKRGDVVGLVGSTGRSTGPHLHYEIIVNGRQANPMHWISHFWAGQSQLYRR